MGHGLVAGDDAVGSVDARATDGRGCVESVSVGRVDDLSFSVRMFMCVNVYLCGFAYLGIF